MSKPPAPDSIPAMTMPELKNALREGLLLFARSRGMDPQMVSDALIDSQAVAVRSSARRIAAVVAQRTEAPSREPIRPALSPAYATETVIRDPSNGSVTRYGAGMRP